MFVVLLLFLNVFANQSIVDFYRELTDKSAYLVDNDNFTMFSIGIVENNNFVSKIAIPPVSSFITRKNMWIGQKSSKHEGKYDYFQNVQKAVTIGENIEILYLEKHEENMAILINDIIYHFHIDPLTMINSILSDQKVNSSIVELKKSYSKIYIVSAWYEATSQLKISRPKNNHIDFVAVIGNIKVIGEHNYTISRNRRMTVVLNNI